MQVKDEVTRTIAEAIRHGLERLTPTERKAARILLANYPVPGLQTVAQFAKQAAVSHPTILRLVNKLGCDSYSDFQQMLRDELEARLRSPLTKSVVRRQGTVEAEKDFLEDYGRSVVASISTSLREIPRAEFDGAIALLADTRRPVSILGGRLTASLALQFYAHLRELRPRVDLIDRQTASWAESLLDVGQHDILIAFDIRRYQDDVIAFAKEAASRGADVLLFTDEWLSPIAAVARHVFALRTSVISNWDSFAALCAVVEAIIAKLSSERWGDVKRRIEKLETIRENLGSGRTQER